MFELSNVSHRRQGRPVLSNISLTIARGKATCLIGESGSGKTSLLRLLNRLESPQSGHILYNGEPLESYPVRELRRRVAFAFQAPVMFEGTVLQNVLTSVRLAEVRNAPGPQHQERARTLLAMAELDPDYADRDAGRLSGGEKQRVALARALMSNPDVLLLDEPTSALDPASAERVVAMLARLINQGLTVVMATHRMDEVEELGARVIVMESGKVAERGGAELAARQEHGL